MIYQVCDSDKKEAKRALNGAKCDQNDGNLLRPARFRRGTAEQCFAPDSRIRVSLFLKYSSELRGTFELCGARAGSIL